MNINGAGEVLERAFGAVLEATVLGSILIVLAALVQWVAGKRLGPSWRFALWGIVLVRLLAPIAPESRWSVFNAGQWFAEEKSAPVVRMQVESATLMVPAMAGEAVELGFPMEAPAFASEAYVRHPFPWRMLGMSVWGMGVVWLLGRLLLGTWWLRRKIRAEVRQSGLEGTRGESRDLNEAVEAAAAEMGVRWRFRVVETGLVSSPALFGIWRPQLLVPRGFAGKLNAQELRYVLLHEFAHLKRWDLITNWLMTVAQAVHWFNPLVWLALRQMRMERELACDEMVLRASGSGAEEGRAYGETILRLLEGVKPRRSLPALVGIAEEKHSARKRILQIVGFDARRPRRRVLGILLLVVIGVGGLTNAQTERSESVVKGVEAKAGLSSDKDSSKTQEATKHSRLVNDARLLMEMGRLDEAEAKLREVLKADPERRAAKYYLTLIEERRQRMVIDDSISDRAPITRLDPPISLPPERRYISNETLASDRGLSDRGIRRYIEGQRNNEEEREARLIEALKLNPQDTKVEAELKSLKERRFAQEALKREVISSRGPGRAAMMKKLNELVVEYYEVANGVPLHEVIKDIHRLARKLDPEEVGVNFVVSGRLNDPPMEETGTGFEPLSGRGKMPLKVTDYVVQISPPLRNATMLGLLNAIVEVAEPPKEHAGAPPLRYSVEDYAIVFGQKVREAQLYTRTFKIAPNTFLQGLKPVADINQVLQGNEAVRDFFTASGIDIGTFSPHFERSSPPQKAIFYNDRTGVLMVRATLGELELIDKALQSLIGAVLGRVLMTVDVVEVKSRDQLEGLIRTLKINGQSKTAAITTMVYREFQSASTNTGLRPLRMKVTTVSGRPARISIEGKVSVDLTPYYREADKVFTVTASSADPKNGKGESNKGVMFDGETMVLLPKVEGDTVTPARVVFITPELIDPAGNLINKSDDHFIRSIELEVPEK